MIKKRMLRKYFSRFKRVFSRKAPTRGHGVLEFSLAAKRAHMAKKIITRFNKSGRILDIGCGKYPIFLLTVKFMQKYAIEHCAFDTDALRRRIQILTTPLTPDTQGMALEGFDVITMLAVMEHMHRDEIDALVPQLYRLMKNDGIIVITIPSPWTEYVLRFLAHIGLLSPEEIHDHKSVLPNCEIKNILISNGFTAIENGFFECFLNRWFVGVKK